MMLTVHVIDDDDATPRPTSWLLTTRRLSTTTAIDLATSNRSSKQ